MYDDVTHSKLKHELIPHFYVLVILWCLNRLSSTFFLMTSRFNTNAFSLSLHNERWWRTLNLFCNRNSRKERANIDCECWWWEHRARTIFLFNFRYTFTHTHSIHHIPHTSCIHWLACRLFFYHATFFLSVSKAIKSDEKCGVTIMVNLSGNFSGLSFFADVHA